jgi:DNA-binding transcriptional LysR family regulator
MMDIEYARTFLKVVDSGSFVGAAGALHLTQAAVSRRIRALERHLGCTLFTRNKAGAVLTPAGRRFLRHATTLVQTLERARHEVGVARTFTDTLAIGGRFGLWDGLMMHWLGAFAARHPTVQLYTQIGFEEGLMHALVDGRLDLGVMYTPQSRPGLAVERLLEEELVLVTSRPGTAAAPRPDDYVHVDWGPEFRSALIVSIPELSSPQLTVGIGWLGLQYLLERPGAAYFPRRMVDGLVGDGRLQRVPGAPTFGLPAYMVYANGDSNPLLRSAVALLHDMAGQAGVA